MTNITTFQLNNYISPSRLKLWLRCPLAFKLRYIDGIVSPPTPGMFLGKVVHAALEHYYRQRMRGICLSPSVAGDQTRRLWGQALKDEPVQFQSAKEELELRTQAQGLVFAYVSKMQGEEGAPIQVEARLEAPLVDPGTGEDLGIPLLGVVDLVLKTKAGPVIIDFKTAARSSSGVSVLHEIQLTCYSYLFRKLTGEREQAIEVRSLIKTKTPKIQFERYEPRTDEHFERLFGVIHSYLDAIRSNRFHISPGLECGFCDFRKLSCEPKEKPANLDLLGAA